MVNSGPKADIIIDTTYGKNDFFKNISELEKDFPSEISNHSFGDMVIITRENKTTYYFIGKKGCLIENKEDDYNEITIPFEITQYLNNAVWKYSNISYSGVYLRNDDLFLKEKIGDCLAEWNFMYLLLEDHRTLIVKFPNENEELFHHEFDIVKIKSQDIYDYYINTFKTQSQFKVKYTFEGPDYERFISTYGDLFKKPTISTIWTEESLGCGGGSKHHHGITSYRGPIDMKEEIVDTIKEFYQDFNYELIF